MPKSKKQQIGLLDTWGRRNRKLADRLCPQCGNLFHPLRQSSKYCSRKCAWANNGGKNKKPESWWVNKRGYVEGKIWLSNNTYIRVKQHRFIMEGIIGRPLKSSEDVHHIDGNKSNNKPHNLELIEHGIHSTKTNKSRSHKGGYKLNLSDNERKARSLRAIACRLSRMGRTSIAKAKGES